MNTQNPVPKRASRLPQPASQSYSSAGIHPEDAPYTTTTQRKRYPLTDDIENEDRFYCQDVTPGTSTRRYRTTDSQLAMQGTTAVIVHDRRRRRHQAATEKRPEPAPQKHVPRFHWMVFLGGSLV